MARTRKTPEPGPGRVARLAGAAMSTAAAHPAGTAGGIAMASVAIAILTNALAMQPGAHPAPLFLGTRPAPAGEVVLRTPAAAADDAGSIDELVRRTTGEVRPAVDPGLVSEIQAELKARGFYLGDVDGLTGPMTSAAIIRFEEEEGIAVSGEPTGDVLAALRKGRPDRRSDAGDAAAPPPPATVAAPPLPPARPMAAADAAPPPVALPAVAEGAMPRAEPAVLRTPAPPPAAPAAPSPPDPRLARVQESLDLLGYGPLRPDGRWTAGTRDAIRRFEENRGLPVTGEINEAFVAELVRIGGLALD